MLGQFLAAGVGAFAVLNAGIAAAVPSLDQRLGHTVEVRAENFVEVLYIDGQRVHEDGFIAFDALEMVAGIAVVVGIAGPGGNACSGAPFVVSLPPGQAPVLFGPAETCSGLRLSIEETRIVFTGYPTPLAAAEQWIWTPAEGFVEADPIPFVPESGFGWDNFLGATIEHPFDLFFSAEFAAQAAALLGKSRETFLLALNGPGAGRLRGTAYVGDACFPHNCPYSQAFIFADPKTRSLYLAWRVEGVETVAPALPEWPAAARSELEAWQARR